MIYLDYNATTPIRTSVKAAMYEAIDLYGNPSSVHKIGRRAKGMIENARESIASNLGVAPEQVYFTSGGTEANNLVLKADYGHGAQFFTSAVEHPSVSACIPNANIIPVNQNSEVDLTQIESMLSNAGDIPKVVSFMYANNETGYIFPIARIAEIARRYKAIIHTDAIQAYGKIKFKFDDLGVDCMSISGHKIGAAKGIGALIVSKNYPTQPLISGSGQERGMRSGTENVPGIASLGAAVEEMVSDPIAQIREMRDSMEKEIISCAENAKIICLNKERLPNTSMISMPGISTQNQIIEFDLQGFAVSAGSACSSGKHVSSNILNGMGLDCEITQSVIRVSLGWQTTPEEVRAFTNAWRDLYQRKGAA